MTNVSSSVIASELPADFSLESVFPMLAQRTGCLWLDSSSASGNQALGQRANDQLSRYSFFTSDPIESLTVMPGQSDAWPKLISWCEDLCPVLDPNLPPFQGGIAGLIGYEAATWLEDLGDLPENDLPTPAICVGVYDWCLAVDHVAGKTWVIVRDVMPGKYPNTNSALPERMDQVLGWIDEASQGPTVGAEAVSVSSCKRPTPSTGFATDHPGITSNFPPRDFRLAVQEIVQRICRGDSFQVNLAQRLLATTTGSSPQLYERLRRVNPAPFAAYYAGDGFEVLSSSPEGFLKVRDGVVETRPIKGTISRSGEEAIDNELAQQLATSEKDRAENVMIVDLMRNDLSKVCQDDSVQVTQLCELETYQYVQHLVSVVKGTLRREENAATLLRACFPGGSVTGAPKVEAMRTIAQLEPHRRGPYCGSIGYISTPSTADFNILIRTITATSGQLQIPVGGGITARSNPESEEAETWTKAKGMLKALTEPPQ